MTEVRKNITLDAISQLASIFMNHHRGKDEVIVSTPLKDEEYDLVISIKRVPKRKEA